MTRIVRRWLVRLTVAGSLAVIGVMVTLAIVALTQSSTPIYRQIKIGMTTADVTRITRQDCSGYSADLFLSEPRFWSPWSVFRVDYSRDPDGLLRVVGVVYDPKDDRSLLERLQDEYQYQKFQLTGLRNSY